MEKYAIWYWLLLKAQLKKSITWIQIIMMIVLLLFVQSIKVPERSNINVGVCYGHSSYASCIGACLQEQDSIFCFLEYDSMETLKKDVVAGTVECGFCFADDFDERMMNGNLNKSVLYFATPMSAKGEVIQESFYTAFLQIYSEKIIEQCEMEIYGATDSERIAAILEQNQSYLDGNELFSIEIKTLQTDVDEKELTSNTYPLQGTLGLYLFLIFLLAYGRKFETGRGAFRTALCKRERWLYEFLDLMAAGTLPAAVGTIMVLLLPQSRGLGCELVGMLLFLLFSAVWIMIVGVVLKRELNLISGTVMITLVELMICPIFWDISLYVPAIKYLRLCIPLGIYLYI